MCSGLGVNKSVNSQINLIFVGAFHPQSSCWLRFPRRVRPKDLKSWYSQLSCLTFSIKGIVRRTSRKIRLLCPWARHLTGCLYL